MRCYCSSDVSDDINPNGSNISKKIEINNNVFIATMQEYDDLRSLFFSILLLLRNQHTNIYYRYFRWAQENHLIATCIPAIYIHINHPIILIHRWFLCIWWLILRNYSIHGPRSSYPTDSMPIIWSTYNISLDNSTQIRSASCPLPSNNVVN